MVLYDADTFVDASKKADELRTIYDVTLCERGKKQGKQLNRFAQRGFDYFVGTDLSELQPLS